MRVLKLAAAASLPFALALLVGCSGASESDHRGELGSQSDLPATEEPVETISYDEMVNELHSHAATLELPPGADWPPPPPEPEPAPDHEGVMRGFEYERGSGVSIAENQWWCAWAREWLDQRGVSTERESAALEKLVSFKESHHYRANLDDAGREWFDDMLDAASLGDPTLIANDVDLNCE